MKTILSSSSTRPPMGYSGTENEKREDTRTSRPVSTLSMIHLKVGNNTRRLEGFPSYNCIFLDKKKESPHKYPFLETACPRQLTQAEVLPHWEREKKR